MMITLSCTSLMNGQDQPVHLIDGKTNTYMTTCSGMAETMGMCYDKAKRTCKSGYQVLDEVRESSGVHRQLRFQCKE
jgi:hypothetical protein